MNHISGAERAVLKEYLIGTGGWAYFRIPRLHPLAAYSKAFNFVEVNSTFYQIPPLKEVETWRRLVPSNFQFTVRANRAITHKHKLQPIQEAFETFERMKQICKILNADILHIQTPQSFQLTQTSISNLRAFLSSVDLGKLRLAIEIRGIPASMVPFDLLKTMQDYNLIHCVDLSKGEMPAYESDVLYSRLFGKGYHNIYQPTDEELTQIDKKAQIANFSKVVMSFHFIRMYKDAARLKTYKQSGKFPSVTKSTGLSSLEEILREDAQFPATRSELIDRQGWKLFDLTQEKRIHARGFLQKLPEKTYNNISEIIDTLNSKLR
jgi:uncharacterized protein YecE (DUF72 family)